ncbi:hypothetical protein F8388_016078 [Cannabis sativa]|uniref:18 kDa seed maturation protein n=1 Tax=Cannabis sativa TaxID=3483 RepID=A0A7J6I4E9_CANSA|nr:hypothetical protein F8388_016078 [Cannabis sativa]KAF4402464.1 hypothetical protein G4B88_012249 [Cannabis sativa]
MQSGKNAVESAKESAANVAASAKSGMDKTKATVQEKVERMTAHHPLEKEIATERKEQKIAEAELNKQQAREQNAAAKEAARMGTNVGGHTGYSAVGTGTTAYSATGATGQPTGHVTEGIAKTHPIGTHAGTGTGTGRTTTQDPSGGAPGYGTGGY